MKAVKNFAEFWSLINRMPGAHDGLKEELVLSFTDGRTDSLREMREDEYKRMCASMRESVNGGMSEERLQIELKKRRSAVLHRIQQLGVDTTSWANVDNFCMQPRIAGKIFRRLTIEELSGLIPKLENIRRKQQIKAPRVPEELLGILISVN
ncbi:hypothetical protein [Petrimonas sulfuriphila]|uniref:hypothetical protein n=1 Tax=Petrimonas sulfuriphila TaxID=285070 RepID=UPI000F0C4279|nr:Hypothetical protein PEIBARAKI_6634 [Petrimonas sp. IBARAKI]